MRQIILFTRKYPYGFHETFLAAELEYLAEKFDRILIVPNQSAPDMRDVSKNVMVDTRLTLKEMGKFRYIVKAIFTISFNLFFKEISQHSKYFLSPKALWRILMNLEEASRVQRYLNRLKRKCELESGGTILYTYWLGGQSLGVSLFKEKNPDQLFVSRVHRGDLYEESHQLPYLPFRKEIYHNIDKVFLISQDGFDYLQTKFPEMQIPAEIARLGVPDPGFTAVASADGVLRIVSCSTLKDIKRVDLLIAGLSEFSRLYPDQSVEWNHLGSGPLHEHLVQLAGEILDESINWCFHGQMPQEQVIGFYRKNPIDLLINVSSSEGIPVSIMEAQSCGIPVIATAVGGTPEIVNNHNGILLPADPSPVEIAQAIQSINLALDLKKNNSKKQWEEIYHARDNYQRFVNSLYSLFD